MKFFCQRWIFPRDFPNRGRIGAVNPEAWLWDGLPGPTMDLQMLGFAGAFLQAGHGLRLLDGVLGHLAIGRPFAARDRQQPGV
jgi:hypothetical protein